VRTIRQGRLVHLKVADNDDQLVAARSDIQAWPRSSARVMSKAATHFATRPRAGFFMRVFAFFYGTTAVGASGSGGWGRLIT